MIYDEFIKKCSESSKTRDRKLTQEDMKMAITLMKEVVAESINNNESVRIKDFLVFEPVVQKGRKIKAINGEQKGERIATPDKTVMRVRQSAKFKALVEKDM